MSLDVAERADLGCGALVLLHRRADDVLRARLKTVGVSEYKFEMETAAGRDSGTEWRIVDVGGSRSQVRSPLPSAAFFLTSTIYLFAAR